MGTRGMAITALSIAASAWILLPRNGRADSGEENLCWTQGIPEDNQCELTYYGQYCEVECSEAYYACCKITNPISCVCVPN